MKKQFSVWNLIYHSNLSIIFIIMFLTGFAGLLYEVVLLLLVAVLIGATAISASIVLASFLLGLAIGALMGGILTRKYVNYVYLLIISEIVISLFGFLFIFILKINLLSLPSNLLFWSIIMITLLPTILMGMEIPIAVKILEKYNKIPSTGFVYFSDTLGAVFGALLSGMIIIPVLGFHGAMYFGGFLNLNAAVLAMRLNKKNNFRFLIGIFIFFIIGTVVLFKSENYLQSVNLNFLGALYSINYESKATPIFSVTSPYQHITIAYSPFYGNQLYIDGHLQISELDSLKYHEYLVLPAIAAHPNPKRILVIGDGDGGALYQALKYNFTTIQHVDIDEKVIEVSKLYLKNVHRGALDDKRVERYIMDGRQFLKNTKKGYYDIIILGLPDPFKLELAGLYSKEFYELIKNALSNDGVVIVQTESPYDYLEAHTSILNTIRSVMPNAYNYIVPVVSFDQNGFIIASKFGDPRIVKNKNAFSGKWYNPKENDRLFDLPIFLENYFKNNTIPITTDENPIIHIYMQNNYLLKNVLDNN